ncbi:MAG: 50S ribosomal protein L11 methyltransferase [Rikenellaceae bacterium]|nr:50S ribosomal protein L11 methyltransferase [Rikenellaceae bacterium]
MKYMEYKISCIPDEESSEIMVAELADLGFESFSEYSTVDQSISGYLPAAESARYEEEIQKYLRDTGRPYERIVIADDTNWNAVWESHFEPILIEDRCYIHAPFHEKREDVAHQVVIMPKMSFGTGHHATTSLILARLLDADLKGRYGLDMGSGTGVLAILAVQRGAAHVDAIDIDRWAYENCIENIELNRVRDRITVQQGDASLLGKGEKYDFILANINRNILLSDMMHYARVLKTGGRILFSGFLEVDMGAIQRKAEELGLIPVHSALENGWALVECRKGA